MRRAVVLPVTLAALVLGIGTAGAASATATQTAADLSIKKSQLSSYHKEGSKAVKGPISEESCDKKVTFVPKGATSNVQAFTRTRSHAVEADGLHVVLDEVVITTTLAKDEASATKTFLGVRVADKHCTHQDISDGLDGLDLHSKVKATSAPALAHTDRGFTETISNNSTLAIHGTSVTVTGTVQSLYFQRGRALTSVTLTRSEAVGTSDGATLHSITYLSNGATKAELKRIAKLTVAALGKQTAA